MDAAASGPAAPGPAMLRGPQFVGIVSEITFTRRLSNVDLTQFVNFYFLTGSGKSPLSSVGIAGGLGVHPPPS